MLSPFSSPDTLIMIRPLTLTCARDWPCFEMLIESAYHGEHMAPWTAFYDEHESTSGSMEVFCDSHHVRLTSRRMGFSPWAERSADVKASCLATLLRQASDDDYLLHVDSDCVFYSPDALGLLNGSADVIGPLHGETVRALGSEFSWCSGAFMALRAGKLREVLDVMPVHEAQQMMRREGLGPRDGDSPTWHDDVVISFMMYAAGATFRNAAPLVQTGDLEAVETGRSPKPSVLHYGTNRRMFLGEMRDKWDFPGAIRAMRAQAMR